MADESAGERATADNSDQGAGLPQLARPVVMPETFSGIGTERFKIQSTGIRDVCRYQRLGH